MQRAFDLSCLAVSIRLGSEGQRVGIRLDDAFEIWIDLNVDCQVNRGLKVAST